MKSLIALVLFIACAAQVHSACVNTNYLQRDYVHPSRCGLYNNRYHDSLDYYPRAVVTVGAPYSAGSCSCGRCSSCRSAVHPYYSSFFLP